jgi:hypothetical protein
MVFFGEIHVFLQLRQIGLLGANRANLHQKHLSCRRHSFQKVIQFSQGNNVLHAPASNADGFLYGIHLFLNLHEGAYLEQNEPFSTLETMICRKCSFQKLTQVSQSNNVPDAAASNIDGFLWRGSCIFLTQLKKSIWSKHSLTPP